MPGDHEARYIDASRDLAHGTREGHILRMSDERPADVRSDRPTQSWEPIPFEYLDLAGNETEPSQGRHVDGRLGTVRVTIELGRVRLPRERIASLDTGDVVSMDQDAQHPVAVLVNGVVVAHGQLVTVDGRIAVRVTERLDENVALQAVVRRKAA